MKKSLLLFCFAFVNCCLVIAQNNTGEIFSGCGTNYLLKQNQALNAAQNSLNNDAYKYLSGAAKQMHPTTVVQYIPVVVHIVHNGGPENISNLQVQTAISDINANYRANDNAQIQFCLAQRDPSGNPTNGITRDVSPLTNETMETDDIALKNINRWSPTCYLNIWIIAGINSLSSGPSVIGYAYFPAAHGMAMDGVVIEAAFFGSSAANDAVGTHEIGHYLGLYHTFENACPNNNCLLDGDQVCDTPPDQTTFSSCAPNANSCSTDADDPSSNNPFSTDVPDLGNDYMDYSNFTCYNMFTPGQYVRMNYFLNNVRSSLLNCLSCSTPCPAPVTASITLPVPPVTVTTGTSVNFQGTFTNALGQQWYLNPGSVLSTAPAFSYTFTSQGSYWMKYRAISSDPTFCLDAIDSIQIIVTEPVSTSCEGSIDLTQPNSSVHLPLTTDIYSSNGFTWECWVKLTAPFGTSYYRPMIIAIDEAVYEDMALCFGWNGGVGNVPLTSLAFKVDGPGGPSPNTCNYAPPGGFVPGTWYHVAGTMNYTTHTGKLYLNGALVDTKTINSAPFARIIPGQLGWDNALNPDYPNPPMGGNLDEVRIWKRVRTDAEIAANYNQCLAGNETDLLMYYRANQTAGTDCLDATPATNNGTLTATAHWSTEQAAILTTNCANLCNSFCPPILASADTTICSGNSTQLDVSGGYSSYSWAPATGLSDTAIANPIANPAVTTTYTVTGTNLDSNLVVNPDFALGNYGFSSGQTYSAVYTPCNYDVGPTFFSGLPGLLDHTPTSDNYYMSIDGCTTGPTKLWEQTIPAITANTDYNFGFWASRSGATQPVFEIHAIGNVTGDVIVATQTGLPGVVGSTAFSWDQYGVPVWNSGPNTSVTFKIINNTTDGYGNDFGMDDFDFRRICISSDSVKVTVGNFSYPLNLGNDTTLCGSGVVVMDAGAGFLHYTWQDGSNNQTYTAFGPGTYWVTVIDPCSFSHTDTLHITTAPSPSIHITGNTTVCEGDSIQLSFTGSATFSSFHWVPESYLNCSVCATPVTKPVTSIQYMLVGSTAQGCSAMDSINITVFPSPDHAIGITTADEMCGNADGSVQLAVTDNTSAPYLFNFNNSGYVSAASYSNLASGTYSLVIKDANGCVYDTIAHISSIGSADTLSIPNCFSPNGDNTNDRWFIPSFCGEKISCKIFNRWGTEITTVHENEFWDGQTSSGANAPDGIYYFIAEIEYTSGLKKEFSGFISLIR